MFSAPPPPLSPMWGVCLGGRGCERLGAVKLGDLPGGPRCIGLGAASNPEGGRGVMSVD